MAKKEAPQSLFRRLTRLFRSGPVIKKKIRSVDTTMAVADKTKSSGTLLFQKSLAPTYATITANAYNLSERLMRYQDFQEMEYSLAIDTQIATPDGYVTIGELAEKCKADPNYTFIVYSYDHNKKQIVPALGKQARQTCVDHAWKITFDSGKSIIASPEHRLMLRDGTYRKTEDIQVGDAMMPFYRKDLFEAAEEGTRGYSWIYTMNDKFRGWTKEHQLIAEWIAGRPLTEDECVHHINFVKSDNRPENLKIMTNSDHNSYHAAINNGVKWAPENHEWIEQFKKNHAKWMRDNAPTRRHDVTFARILETAERVGFSLPAISSALDVTWNLIFERLVSNGFANFEQFVNAYANGQTTAMLVNNRPGLLTRDLSLELIKSIITSEDTKRSLCIKLGCTVNVFDKFLNKRARTTWSELRSTFGYSDKTVVVEQIKSARAGGRPRGSNKGTLTFQQICDAYEPGLTLPRLKEKLGVNKNTIISRLAQNGYQKYSEFSSQYENHKVVSVEYVGEIPLYDLTVDGYKNFATDSVISHNTPEIAAALDIYADETVAADEKGRCLHIYSDNEKVKEILEDLFYNTLNTEFNLRSWARNLVKYGDFFLYNDVSQHYGVVSAFPIPVNEIEREENYDRDDPFAVRYRWVTLGNRVLENWEVTHFRLLGNDMFLPYGSSVIEPARRIWRQLILIEDAMLVYRVVRAPERRVFYIDVANIPAADIPVYMEEQRKNLRSNQVVDRSSGRVDLRYNPLSVDEDYFIPVRGTDSGTKIDTLAGGQNTAAVEDVAYIQKKLFAALKIPRAYLGYDEMLGSKATLAQEDIRFSRTISVIQKVMIAELNKLAIIHLYAHGFDQDDLQNFTLRLSNPSTIAQQQKLELWRTKFEIGGSAPEGYVNKDFVRKEIWGLNDEECKQIDKARLKDKIVDGTIESASAPEDDMGDVGGDDDLFGGGGGGDLGGDETEAPADDLPPEENAGEEPEEEVEPGTELLTSADRNDDDDEHFGLKLSDKEMEVPLKAQRQLDRVLYNRGRHRTHGASKTHMPDFQKMTSNDNHAMEDPYDNDWIKSVVSNPFGESRTNYKTNITSDVMSMLNNWTKSKGGSGVQGNQLNNVLLSEDASSKINSNIDDDEDVLIIDDDGADDE